MLTIASGPTSWASPEDLWYLKEGYGQQASFKNLLWTEISDEMNEKISLATVYNTVHAFQKKGHLKEIAINSDKTYYDTNTSVHHHFYDEDTHELIDCNQNDIDTVNVKNNITGKKINPGSGSHLCDAAGRTHT